MHHVGFTRERRRSENERRFALRHLSSGVYSWADWPFRGERPTFVAAAL
jgi:hypothetical protein